jgi:transposase
MLDILRRWFSPDVPLSQGRPGGSTRDEQSPRQDRCRGTSPPIAGAPVERELEPRSPPTAKTRRTFPREFHVEAVRRIAGQRKGPDEVTREPDPGESMLRVRKQAPAAADDHAFPGRGNPPAWGEEPRRLRAEVERLAVGRDVLQKAVAFFAKGSS